MMALSKRKTFCQVFFQREKLDRVPEGANSFDFVVGRFPKAEEIVGAVDQQGSCQPTGLTELVAFPGEQRAHHVMQVKVIEHDWMKGDGPQGASREVTA